MSKLFLILTYYGNFPNYFQFYLDSVEMNNDILTLIIITDINIDKYIIPSNVIVIKITLEELKYRISKFLLKEFNINVKFINILTKVYKICDYKIIYHILFDDILKQNGITYNDFIGWCDCDIIFGKLSDFIELKKYLIIGFHGHFTALKYIPELIFLYKNIKFLGDILVDQNNHGTDEIQFRQEIIKYININNIECFYNMQLFYCDITEPNLSNNKFIMFTSPNKPIKHIIFNKKKLIVIFEDKDIFETTYCHLQKRSMKINLNELDYERFLITKDCFI